MANADIDAFTAALTVTRATAAGATTFAAARSFACGVIDSTGSP